MRSAVLVLLAAASFAHADPFTYQGKLTTSGAPANGAFDFEFRVYSADTGGSQVGATVTVPGLAVAEGLFSASVDVGSALTTNATATNRYLEIRVRPASSGSFTTLTPREPIQPAPLAQRALREWFQPGAIEVLTNDASRPRLFLNRASPLTTNEYFGFTTPTASGIYGGMYINTANAGGFPFYGYATGGLGRAWTSYDGTLNQWRLFTQSHVRISVDDVGNVGIGVPNPTTRLDVFGTASADNYIYRLPRTRTLSYSPVAFTSANPSSSYVFSPFRAYLPSAIQQVYCPVTLPHGATVTSITIAFEDFSTTENVILMLQSYRYTNPIGPVTHATASSVGAPGNALATSTTIASPVIDNLNFTYHLTYRTANRSGDDNVSMRAASITYTVTEPD